ncbi:MAG: helix-hairpin-helix domain-containing protein, partial [Desulfobacteraceae bacterium]|nr:helix-hairpin-helix domain-containing protein [Desulfobacteraceae bacterium]
LAEMIFSQRGLNPLEQARSFVNESLGVPGPEAALSGAGDIIAEWVNENPDGRARVRRLFLEKGMLLSKVAAGKETEGAKYKDYFDWQEPAAKTPSHRILAIRRGEKEDILNVSIHPPESEALAVLESLFVKGNGPDAAVVRAATRDAFKRLLSPSMETETRLQLKERADMEAIRVFADNLRDLLLAPPLGARRVMGIDPGFRTGCKVVCLDRQGRLLCHDTLFPHGSKHQRAEAAGKLLQLAENRKVEAIAVGNGTAGRETEAFVRNAGLPEHLPIVMVNESGASIYSASEAARQEFPDLDLTVRGAVSIGRRLMDPLSELVKIDPKSIGVGQYQHDVDQTALKRALDDVVISCVNRVGVDVNRASAELLTYISGLGDRLARNIVAHRNENGPFLSRKRLLEVHRLGPKAFEQCAGFLRIVDGENPLDASAVHPESYPVVSAMAADLDCTVADLMRDASLRNRIVLERYVSDSVGLPTLTDILRELVKPGRDPRDDFESVAFSEEVKAIGDVLPGMRLPGVVTNVTAFGAFVDIGVHQDGLVHISEMADRFVKDPSEVVKVQQKVTVTVLEVDLQRRRISLSLREKSFSPAAEKRPKHRSSEGRKRKGPIRKGNRVFHNPFADVFGKS